MRAHSEKAHFALTVVLSFVAAAGGALLGARLLSGEPERAAIVAPGSDVSAASPSEVASLRRELGELRERTSELVLRLTALEVRPETRQPAVEAAPRAGELERRVDQLAAALNPDSTAPQAVRSSVEQALGEIRVEEERARNVRRQEAIVSALDARLADLSAKLSLAPYQTEELRTTLLAESEKRNELMNQMREVGDFGAMRDGIMALREETRTSISGILSPEQLTRYEELESDRFGRGFGPPRGQSDAGGEPGGRGRRGGGR